MLAKKDKKSSLLEIGNRVRLRGREVEGYLIWMNDLEIKKRWAMVWWDGMEGAFDKDHPKYCGYVELEKVNENV